MKSKPSLSIALNMSKRKPMMKDGGRVPASDTSEGQGLESIRKAFNSGRDPAAEPSPKPSPNYSVPGMAQGGEVEDHYASIADAILAKKRSAKAEQDGAEHPAGLESDNDSRRPAMDDYMSDHEQMLAAGGMVAGAEADGEQDPAGLESDDDQMALKKENYMSDEMPHFAEGGEVSIADTIRKRRKEQMNPPSDGMVSLEDNSEEEPNQYDALDGKSANEEQYDSGQISPQPEDSNEHGDSAEESLLDAVRRKMSNKRK